MLKSALVPLPWVPEVLTPGLLKSVAAGGGGGRGWKTGSHTNLFQYTNIHTRSNNNPTDGPTALTRALSICFAQCLSGYSQNQLHNCMSEPPGNGETEDEYYWD